MYRRLAVLLLLGAPNLVQAQTELDNYLPAQSHIYLRWDGVDAHRKAFNKTAVGKMMRGEPGKFFSAIYTYLKTNGGTLMRKYEPSMAPLFDRAMAETGEAFNVVGKNGFRFGVEFKSLSPIEIEGVLVLPKGASGKTDLLALCDRLTKFGDQKIKKVKIAGRTVHKLSVEPVEIGWWNENGNAVFSFGTTSPKATIERINGKGPKLSAKALYKKVSSFKEFRTWGSGYVDLKTAFKKVSALNPDVKELIGKLGLNGVGSITFHSGFDGPAERSVIDLHIPGPRKGLLRAGKTKSISLMDLPPLPPQLTSFSTSNLDLVNSYDSLLDGVTTAVKIFAPQAAGQVKGGIAQVEALLGVKLRQELLASFGNVAVSYNSPSDGPLGFGSMYLMKVKDEEKLKKSLDSILNVAQTLLIAQVEVKTVKYGKAEIKQVSITGQGFQAPSYTIYNGWFAFASYPQPIRGFIARADGKLPKWTPSKELTTVLSKMPKKFSSISVSKPAPTVRLLFSVMPPLIGAMNTYLAQEAPEIPAFDINLVPNADIAAKDLFPNVTITTDKGNVIRTEVRASLMLPF